MSLAASVAASDALSERAKAAHAVLVGTVRSAADGTPSEPPVSRSASLLSTRAAAARVALLQTLRSDDAVLCDRSSDGGRSGLATPAPAPRSPAPSGSSRVAAAKESAAVKALAERTAGRTASAAASSASRNRTLTPPRADGPSAGALEGAAFRTTADLAGPEMRSGDAGFFLLWAWATGTDAAFAAVVTEEAASRLLLSERMQSELSVAVASYSSGVVVRLQEAVGMHRDGAAEASRVQEELAAAKAAASQLRDALQKAESEAEWLKGELKDTASQLDEERAKAAKATSECSALRSEVAAEKTACGELRGKLEKAVANAAELDGELGCVRAAAAQLQEDMSRLGSELADTRRSLREREAEVTESKLGGKELEKAKADMRSQRAQAQASAAIRDHMLSEAVGRSDLLTKSYGHAASLFSQALAAAAAEASEAAAQAKRPEGDIVKCELGPSGKLGATWFGDSCQLKDTSAEGILRAAGGQKYVGRHVSHINGKGVASAGAMGAMLRPGLKMEICFAPSVPKPGDAAALHGLTGDAAPLNGARGVVVASDAQAASASVDLGPPHGIKSLPASKLLALQPSACVAYVTEEAVADLRKQLASALKECASSESSERRVRYALKSAALSQQLVAAEKAIVAPPQGSRVVTHGMLSSNGINGEVGKVEKTEILAGGSVAVHVRFKTPKDQVVRLRPCNLLKLP